MANIDNTFLRNANYLASNVSTLRAGVSAELTAYQSAKPTPQQLRVRLSEPLSLQLIF